ncbi:MAG: exopolysaccharide biosynthesis polyprenyl glycosylphosphotransferase [Alphaproteobacteria bacterium]|nr:exopolysaccharide biosynthesis polyprenyl glycosylphosphotransferase [Alphaproteobacteria bacterium]MDE2493205.1 exopolysaccharide biosynthesis polyprenyl glycosylphosphotransferase [Alphaproteobacteria bacterium]
MSERDITAEGRAHNLTFRWPFNVSGYRYWLRIVVVASVDVLAIFMASLFFRTGRMVPEVVFFSPNPLQPTAVDIFYVLGFLFILVRYISGDYSRRRLFWDDTRVVVIAIIITSIPCFLIASALPGRYSAITELSSWGFLLFTIPCFRQVARVAMARAGLWREPTALIVNGARAGRIYEALNNALSLGYNIRWIATDGSEMPSNVHRLKQLYFSDPDEIVNRLVADGCNQAVVVTDDMQSSKFADLIQRLMEEEISVSFVPSFRRLPLVGVTTSYFFGHDILLFQVRGGLQRFPQRLVKRVFDLVGSLALLMLLAPVFGIIALFIKRHDAGPAFYAQRRVGRFGKQFGCLKFRTMTTDADERLNRWKIEKPEMYEQFLKAYKLTDDPRITRPGKWLRRTSLDELPQLVNVLRGEMSLVGPRPIPEQQLREQYGRAAQLYSRVRPGLTGLWQISGRNDTSLEDRVNYDEWYILNWSFWYDIVILLQTAWIVITGRGAY